MVMDAPLGGLHFGEYSETGVTTEPTILPIYTGKRVLAHVYTSAGAYLRSWPDMVSQLAYSWPINGGQSSVEVQLARVLDATGEPGDTSSISELSEDNLVKFYIVDQESGVDGVLQYQGFIEQHEITFPATDSVKVTLVPRTATFKDSYIRGAVLGGDQDPITMLTNIFNAGYMPGITLDPTNPAAVGITYADQDFSKQNIGQVMERLRKMAGANWYWRLNPDNTLTFNKWDIHATPAHTLTSRQYTTIRYIRSKINIKERVYVYGADKDANGVAIVPRIEAVATVPGYNQAVRARDLVISDERITTAATAQAIANSELEYNQHAMIESEIQIPDKSFDPVNGYDVESLKPGQMLVALSDKVYDRPKYGTALYATDRYGGVFASLVQRPLVIAEVRYTPNYATVKLTSRPADYIEALVALSDRQLVGATS